jgi:ElaB/YqjD/DUF883 family membrane-anchored ribosome-binding protein
MTARHEKSTAAAGEVAAIENLLSDLERRLRRLSRLSNSAQHEISGAGSDVGDFFSEALADIVHRVRESTADVGQSIVDRASQVASNTTEKIVDEVEQRPLMMLAIAVGVGFLAGYANRRQPHAA